MNNKLHIYPTQEELSLGLASEVTLLARQCTDRQNRFTVAFSGGSLMQILSRQLVKNTFSSQANWSAWQVFWADERCVPGYSPDSNSGTARRLLLQHVDIPKNQIQAVNISLEPSEAAREYQTRMHQVLRPPAGNLPRFDLILLGIGPDGHTASLFPNHPLLLEKKKWAAPVYDSPKPPPLRVTLTLPVINQARHVICVASGREKAPVVFSVFEPSSHEPRLPAAMVNPVAGTLKWFVDSAAAGKLMQVAGSG